MKEYTFSDLRGIIRRLRAPDGCPWDREQTHESLIPCMLEEAQEAVDGIHILTETRDSDNLCEELGDVLLQVLMHSQIGEEEGLFTLDDVIQGISEKMVRRHPHVFGGKDGKTASEVPETWEEIKKKEKMEKNGKNEIKNV